MNASSRHCFNFVALQQVISIYKRMGYAWCFRFKFTEIDENLVGYQYRRREYWACFKVFRKRCSWFPGRILSTATLYFCGKWFDVMRSDLGIQKLRRLIIWISLQSFTKLINAKDTSNKFDLLNAILLLTKSLSQRITNRRLSKTYIFKETVWMRSWLAFIYN